MGAAVLSAIVVVYAPLLLLSPRFTWASITNLLARSSWETPWALIDGYMGYGNLPGPLETRLDPAAAQAVAHASALPGIVPLLVLVVGLAVAWWSVPSTLPMAPKLVGRCALLVVAFALLNKGWSPQYITWVLPFPLLLLPARRGVLHALALTAVTLLEFPYGFAAGPSMVAIAVMARTGLLALLALDIHQELRRCGVLLGTQDEQSPAVTLAGGGA